MGKASISFRDGRAKPWRVRWYEHEGNKLREREKSFGCGLKAGAFRVLHSDEDETFEQLAMSVTDRARWWKAKDVCALAGVELEAALDAGIAALKKAKPKSETLVNALGFWVIEAEARGLRVPSIKNVKFRVQSFMKGREQRNVSEFTGDDLLAWVEPQYTNQASRDKVLAWLLQFFRWCAEAPRRWTVVDFSNVRWSRRVIADKQRVGFFSHADAHAICRHAPPSIALAVATGFLLGARPFELMRIRFSYTSESGEFFGFVAAAGEWHISAQWAKTRVFRKLHTLPDAWWFWFIKYRAHLNLARSKKRRGSMVPFGYDRFRDEFKAAAKRAGVLRIPDDGLRHSFGTHGFHRSADGKERGVEWCISNLGHVGGYRTFDKSYNGRVGAAEAEAYFINYPDGSAMLIKTRERVIVDTATGTILFTQSAVVALDMHETTRAAA